MPLQNRVLATGEVIATHARGMFMGNRGVLHDERQRLGAARWKHKAWVTCVLKHKNWHRDVMTPGHYTELFFLDEAVALAAGHRPCAMCRHADYVSYRAAAGLTGTASEMDAQMHAERAVPRRFLQCRDVAELAEQPDGTIILDQVPKLVHGDALFPVSPKGYGKAERRTRGQVALLTPKTSRDALAAGYRPKYHPSL
jgi:cytochrome c5